jgi:hypothetical protein
MFGRVVILVCSRFYVAFYPATLKARCAALVQSTARTIFMVALPLQRQIAA